MLAFKIKLKRKEHDTDTLTCLIDKHMHTQNVFRNHNDNAKSLRERMQMHIRSLYQTVLPNYITQRNMSNFLGVLSNQ